MLRKFNRPGFRLLSLALSLLVLFTMALPAAATPADANPLHTYTSTSMVYYGPYKNSAPIGQLASGTMVTVRAEYNGYYEIDCYNMIGYIAKDQVEQKADGNYYIITIPGARNFSPDANTTLADALTQRAAILDLTRKQVGYPYVYGGRFPGGFDCSGLVYYVYGKSGYDLHRCADDQMQDGIIVSREGLQVGDLLFFTDGSYHLATHVGIYVGNNQMIHASTSKGICYANLDAYCTYSHFLGARRIINTADNDITIVPTNAAAFTISSASNPTAGIRSVS